MLYYLLYPLRDLVSAFNVFRYITFRTSYAALTALLISFVLGPWLIKRMTRIKLGQYIREEGPQSHHQKAGTPTMGGILIVLAIMIPTILWADILNPYIWIILFVTFGYAAIGFIDDFQKLVKKQNLGLTAKQKFALQFLVAAIAGSAIAYLPQIHTQYSTVLTFPFIKNFVLDLGFFYIPFIMIVIVGASNAVNLTDGLDGLAIGSVLIAAVTYTVLTYASGHARI
ncbi:MAG TPA: phospho-N-acetylmuramoyl-pentapeptide-transferase, partial [Thermoanaerobaculia bacterium]|nr:phospho-N-acetylmuramoyl-pentapeptide-transferase [Thermoanaerobaculia bacterium]